MTSLVATCVVVAPAILAAGLAIQNFAALMRLRERGADGAPHSNLPVPFVSIVLCVLSTGLARPLSLSHLAPALMLPAILDVGNWRLVFVVVRDAIVAIRGK